jgi:long-chain acyl-CoA synthetase
VGRAVQRANESVSQAESIREFAIVDREFSIDEGELTPTLKIKRDVVAARHASLIDDLYRRRSPETMAGR